jgi:hypothetical protein
MFNYVYLGGCVHRDRHIDFSSPCGSYAAPNTGSTHYLPNNPRAMDGLPRTKLSAEAYLVRTTTLPMHVSFFVSQGLSTIGTIATFTPTTQSQIPTAPSTTLNQSHTYIVAPRLLGSCCGNAPIAAMGTRGIWTIDLESLLT